MGIWLCSRLLCYSRRCIHTVLLSLSGLNALRQGKYDETEPLCRHAMEITEATVGTDHPDYSIRLGNLAGLLEMQASVTMSGASVCGNVPGMLAINACCWHRLISPSLPQGKFEYFDPLYRRALEITEATLSKDHPNFSVGLNNLAGLLQKQVKATMFCCTPGAHITALHVSDGTVTLTSSCHFHCRARTRAPSILSVWH